MPTLSPKRWSLQLFLFHWHPEPSNHWRSPKQLSNDVSHPSLIADRIMINTQTRSPCFLFKTSHVLPLLLEKRPQSLVWLSHWEELALQTSPVSPEVTFSSCSVLLDPWTRPFPPLAGPSTACCSVCLDNTDSATCCLLRATSPWPSAKPVPLSSVSQYSVLFLTGTDHSLVFSCVIYSINVCVSY